MNRSLILCGAILAATCAAVAEPRILIQATCAAELGFQKPDSVAASLEDAVQSRIRKEFPCVATLTTHDVGTMLSFMRMRALLGGTIEQQASLDQDLAALGGAMGTDYLVVLNAMATKSRWTLSARWFDVRKAKALAMAMEDFAPGGDSLVDACDRVAEKLVDEVAYFEICPYTGPVKITVNTNRSKEEKEEYPVFCNGMDQQYVKTTSESKVADTELEVTRTRRSWATGTIRYHSVETSKLVEEDPCHACDPTRKGVRIYTESHRTTVDIEGLSEESSTAGQRISDVRPYLKFDRNGTFRLEILATSKPGVRKVHIERKAEGNCDTTVAKPKEDYSMRTDIPLGNVMGPFAGSPRDKVLTGHKEFREKDPVTGEETTINVEFQLQRD
jgi:hypothetical protein